MISDKLLEFYRKTHKKTLQDEKYRDVTPKEPYDFCFEPRKQTTLDHWNSDIQYDRWNRRV